MRGAEYLWRVGLSVRAEERDAIGDAELTNARVRLTSRLAGLMNPPEPPGDEQSNAAAAARERADEWRGGVEPVPRVLRSREQQRERAVTMCCRRRKPAR